MPSPAVNVGTGTTITFGTSSWTANVTNLSHDGNEREAFDTTHLGTAAVGANELNNKTYLLSEVVDGGEITLDAHFNPDDPPPIGDAAETITITFNGGSTYVFSGGVISNSSAVPNDGLMTQSLTIKVCGAITETSPV